MDHDLDTLSDEQLIARYREGVAEAVAVLYRRYYARVASWCLRLSGTPQEAEELAQDVFTRVHSKLGSFRAESRFSTWLYTVTRSVVINRGVSEARRRMDALDEPGAAEPPSHEPGAEVSLLTSEQARAVHDALNALDPLEAKVLYLHYVDGLTLPAITRVLDLSNRSGAKKYIVNGKRHLRRALSEQGLSGVLEP